MQAITVRKINGCIVKTVQQSRPTMCTSLELNPESVHVRLTLQPISKVTILGFSSLETNLGIYCVLHTLLVIFMEYNRGKCTPRFRRGASCGHHLLPQYDIPVHYIPYRACLLFCYSLLVSFSFLYLPAAA